MNAVFFVVYLLFAMVYTYYVVEWPSSKNLPLVWFSGAKWSHNNKLKETHSITAD